MSNRCNPKSASRVPKRPVYITALPPAVLAECREALERQMAASTKGGRPALVHRSNVRGGLKGGPARAKALSASERSAIARQGGVAKWAARRALACSDPVR